MNCEEITLESFTIVGISVRTTNNNGQAMTDIGKLWERFFTEQITESISNKISNDIYCVYTDYESDFTGEYTTLLGYKVSCVDKLSHGLIVKEIEASKYNLYHSEGKLPECVGKTWMDIWQKGEGIDRTYDADFDVYGKESHDPKNAAVKTYLSVK